MFRMTLLVVCAAIAVTSQGAASQFSGVVTDPAGKPVGGAMVTLIDRARGIAESAYSGADGRFTLDSALSGSLAIRVRKHYMEDLQDVVDLPPAGRDGVALELQPMTSAQAISDSLPAAYHFGQIRFESGTPFDRFQFQRDCLTCHQLGNTFTRNVRTAESWAETVKRMHSWLGNFDDNLRDRRAVLLSRAFDGKPLGVRPVFPVDALLTTARVTQYRLDRSVVPHDAEVNPDDGLVYTVDQGTDQIAITDLTAGTTRYVPTPTAGSPPGGKFVTLGYPPLFNLPTARGAHSLAFGPDGKVYTTDAIAGDIGVFDPKTLQWQRPFPIGGKSLYPHTIRFDRTGHAWFSIAYTDEIGRLDPATGKIDVLALPPVKSKGIANVTVPYGIDVHPLDGTVWYSRLFGDKIGRIDPRTLAIVEFDAPVRGPRRMRFDAAGRLWITGFADGEIARLDTTTMESEVYKLPEFAPGYYPAPYALGVHPRTQDIWVNEIMTDHIYRFLPREERWVVYPVPLRGTYTRDVSFTADGRVCMSNNPIPVMALEGGVAELLCIAPDRVAPDVGIATAERSRP